MDLKTLKENILNAEDLKDLAIAKINIAELQNELHCKLIDNKDRLSIAQIKGSLNILGAYIEVLNEKVSEIKKLKQENQRIDYNFRQLARMMLNRTKYNEILLYSKKPKKQAVLELREEYPKE